MSTISIRLPDSLHQMAKTIAAEDHVSMGANEARHVLAMTNDLAKVLGLEILVAAQAIDLRVEMLEAARALAQACSQRGFRPNASAENGRNGYA